MTYLQHPSLPGRIINVADAAVGHYANAGWVPAEGEPPPTCPACGQTWPAYTETERQPGEEAPADAGASASEGTSTPRRRRKASEESDQ
jgi:hypothetical protein